MQALRIVHASNFSLAKYGLIYYASSAYKLSIGFIKNGHFVYDFSYKDVARYESPIRSKRFGINKMNRRLIEVCKNIRPHYLCLGHTESITSQTLQAIKNELPDIKISLYWVDPVWLPNKVQHIINRLEHVDVVFATSGGKDIQQFKTPTNTVSFLPNPVDFAVESLKNFEQTQFDYDLLYCGKVKHESQRYNFLKLLQKTQPNLRLSLNGSFGNPLVFGAKYIQKLAQSKMGLNFSRRNDIVLYSSDRIQQLSANGLLVFSPRIPEFNLLYSDNEIIFFDDMEHLAQLISQYQNDDSLRQSVAKAGWTKAHTAFNAPRVAKFVLETVFNIGYSEQYQWLPHVFR